MRRAARNAGGPGGREPGLQSVGSILEPMLRSLKLDARFAAAAAGDLWDEIVGPEVRARTRCVGVRDGELLVEVRGAVWMGHLAVLRQGFLEQINERLSEEAKIRAIRFVPMRTKEESRP